MLSPRNKGARKRFREPFGKAGLTVAILALVFAMVGGAWAAASLNSKQKKEVKSIAKSFQGTGAAGAPGAAGPAGPKGDTGAKGDKGDTGATGKQGIQGKQGSPWTAGGTLPPGQTETGVWSVAIPAHSLDTYAPISFPIPLAKVGAPGSAHFFTKEKVENEEFGETGCSWTLEDPEATPEASKPGTLCVFGLDEFNLSATGTPSFIHPGDFLNSEANYTPAGVYLDFNPFGSNTEAESAGGVWAVTAPES